MLPGVFVPPVPRSILDYIILVYDSLDQVRDGLLANYREGHSFRRTNNIFSFCFLQLFYYTNTMFCSDLYE